jgi:uncharacterized membrane protein
MSNYWIALSTWLHTLATVVMVGHYALTSLVYLPIYERQIEGVALSNLFNAISLRLRPFIGASLLIFIVTGIHLMLGSEKYLGLGNFGNLWGALIVIKHVVVIAFIGLGIFTERALVSQLSKERPESLNQLRLALNAMTILGAGVLLLTAIAQSA